MPVTEPPLKATFKAGLDAVFGRFRGADIGLDADHHANVAGQGGTYRAYDEADGRPFAKIGEQGGQDNHDDRHRLVFAIQEGRCALRDGAGDLLHSL